MSYWSERKHLRYHQTAVRWAKELTPPGGSILDVGGGVTRGCRYLAGLSGFDRTSVELQGEGESLDGVRVITSDFMDWQPDRRYDTVMCLQCIEHVVNPVSFAQKLLLCGDRLILSVPYQWPKNRCKWHHHDPIGESKLELWTGRKPDRSVIHTQDGKRMVCLYQSTTSSESA